MARLIISLININGLSRERIEAISHSLAGNCDIICITETHLSPNTDISHLSLQGYQEIIRLDRTDGAWGGVGIYIANHVNGTFCGNYVIPGLELLWLTIRNKNKKIMLGLCYRKPSSTAEFWDKLQDSVDMVKGHTDCPIILCGDLNADFQTANGVKLNHFAAQNHFTIHVNTPTRITSASATVLDQFLSNVPDMVKEIRVEPPISNNDHSTVLMTLIFPNARAFTYTRHVWSYKQADIAGYKQALSLVDWDSCFQSEDINVIYELWSEKLLNIAKVYIPNPYVTIRICDKPWYNGSLRCAKRKKDRAHLKAKTSNTPASWNKFKKLRNEYCELIKTAKKEYIEHLGETAETTGVSSKEFWHFAKSVLGKSADNSLPPLKDGADVCLHPKDKAELFNNYFVNKCQLDDSNIDIPDVISYMTTSRLETINILPSDMMDILFSFDINKATGPDLISPVLLKKGAAELAPSIAYMFNYSLLICKLPKIWKSANMVPVLKKGDKQEVSNYRPVSFFQLS